MPRINARYLGMHSGGGGSHTVAICVLAASQAGLRAVRAETEVEGLGLAELRRA